MQEPQKPAMKSAARFFSILLHLLLLYIFWLLMFAIGRLTFLLVYWKDLNSSAGSAIASFYHALPLDTSAACYLLLFAVLVLMAEAIVRHPSVRAIRWVYMILMLLLFFV